MMGLGFDDLLPSLAAMRLITGTLALTFLLGWIASLCRPARIEARIEAASWGLMCGAVVLFTMQFYVGVWLDLTANDPLRQLMLFLALLIMAPALVLARMSAWMRRGATLRRAGADAAAITVVAFSVLALANLTALIF